MLAFRCTDWISYDDVYWSYLEPIVGNLDSIHAKKLPYLMADQDNLYCLMIDENNKILGAVGLQQSPHVGQEGLMWMKFISIHEDYRGRGLARTLVKNTIDYCLTHQKELLLSSFTDDGKIKLKHIFEEFSNQINLYTEEDTYNTESKFNIKYSRKHTTVFPSI